jgi:DNA-binding response OmpR family regulator
MPAEPHHVLVVEDDPTCRALIRDTLTALGFHVTTTDSVFDERRALVVDVIAKPFHPRALAERVRQACERRARGPGRALRTD